MSESKSVVFELALKANLLGTILYDNLVFFCFTLWLKPLAWLCGAESTLSLLHYAIVRACLAIFWNPFTGIIAFILKLIYNVLKLEFAIVSLVLGLPPPPKADSSDGASASSTDSTWPIEDGAEDSAAYNSRLRHKKTMKIVETGNEEKLNNGDAAFGALD